MELENRIPFEQQTYGGQSENEIFTPIEPRVIEEREVYSQIHNSENELGDVASDNIDTPYIAETPEPLNTIEVVDNNVPTVSEFDQKIVSICEEEGVNIAQIPTGVIKGQKEIAFANNHLGFIPHPLDTRWHLIYALSNSAENAAASSMNIQNAMRAVYLSDKHSANGHFHLWNEETTRHIARVARNIELFPTLKTIYDGVIPHITLPGNLNAVFTRTKAIANDQKNRKQIITPCPEALYQVQVYDGNNYIARAGFNMHTEGAKDILSITNIQGRSGLGRNYSYRFQHETGQSLLNIPVQIIQSLAHEGAASEIRGMANPAPKTMDSREIARLQSNYQKIFRSEKIPLYNRVHKSEEVFEE